MKEISNRNFQIILEKLPIVMPLIPRAGLTLREYEALRQLLLMHKALSRNNKKNK